MGASALSKMADIVYTSGFFREFEIPDITKIYLFLILLTNFIINLFLRLFPNIISKNQSYLMKKSQVIKRIIIPESCLFFGFLREAIQPNIFFSGLSFFQDVNNPEMCSHKMAKSELGTAPIKKLIAPRFFSDFFPYRYH